MLTKDVAIATPADLERASVIIFQRAPTRYGNLPEAVIPSGKARCPSSDVGFIVVHETMNL
jgi:hypothetical protein